MFISFICYDYILNYIAMKLKLYNESVFVIINNLINSATEKRDLVINFRMFNKIKFILFIFILLKSTTLSLYTTTINDKIDKDAVFL